MGRYSLFETERMSARVHHIATADHDTALHDHPWDFASVVLRGGYDEFRPWMSTPSWCSGVEAGYVTRRNTGSFALRRASDRHRISSVDADTWTLFVYGKYRNHWGFFTQQLGKMGWRDYLSSGFSKSDPNNNSGETNAEVNSAGPEFRR